MFANILYQFFLGVNRVKTKKQVTSFKDRCGYYVKIKHNDTYSILYAYCSALLVSAGQTIKQGQVIAQVGSTGYSTGPHLHFEVIQNGVRVDALRFFAQ